MDRLPIQSSCYAVNEQYLLENETQTEVLLTKTWIKGGVFHLAYRFSTQFLHIHCILQVKSPIIWTHHLPFARPRYGLSLTMSNIFYSFREKKRLYRKKLVRFYHIKNQCCISTFPFILLMKYSALANRNSRFQCVNGNIYLVINVSLCFPDLVLIINIP